VVAVLLEIIPDLDGHQLSRHTVGRR
jgi:hypothetical protein